MATSTSLPLLGYRVLVTRAREQSATLTEQLKSLGATVVELPAIEITPADPEPLDSAIRNLANYDWIVFTSTNGVAAFMDRLDALELDSSTLFGVQVAAIGRATAERLQERGVRVDAVPERFIAESVVAELASLGIAGKRILLPQAEIARDTVAAGLRNAGAKVDVVIAYRTTLPDGHDVEHVRQLVAGIDIATFASPSSVRNALALAGGSLPATRVVCIGPVTADAAREAGLVVAAVASEYSIDGLAQAIVRLVLDEEEVPDGNQS